MADKHLLYLVVKRFASIAACSSGKTSKPPSSQQRQRSEVMTGEAEKWHQMSNNTHGKCKQR
jgi:hypothetical protein